MILFAVDLLLEANPYAMIEPIDKYTSEMLTLKLVPVLAGCLLLVTRGSVKGANEAVKINPCSTRVRPNRRHH